MGIPGIGVGFPFFRRSGTEYTKLILQPDAGDGIDTAIFSSSPNNNYGIYDIPEIVYNGSNVLSLVLIKFDLSSIPIGTAITSASLRLFSRDDMPSIRAHRSLVEWYEGDSVGGAPSGDGSTWNHRNYNGSIAWGAAGGLAGTDYAVSASDTDVITADNKWAIFDVIDDVQDFVNGDPNYGWWIIPGPGVSGGEIIMSDEATDDIGHRPMLIIEYGQPDPISTLVIQPTNGEETFIGSVSLVPGYEGVNFGQYAGLIVTTSLIPIPEYAYLRSLIRFDLSSFPVGATLLSANVELYTWFTLDQFPTVSGTTVGIHRALTQWYEGDGIGIGPPSGNGSTWNFRNHNGSIPWGTAGGQSGVDFSASPTDSVNVTRGDWTSFDVTDDVSDMLGGGDNYGWWLIAGTESDQQFKPSDDPNFPDDKPRLIIRYTL